MRSIGTSVAGAVAGVILAQLTVSLGGHALPSENGFKVVMALGADAAALAFVLAAFLPRHRPAAPDSTPTATEPSAKTVD